MPNPGPPPQQRTLLRSLTQAGQTILARVDFGRLVLKPNARVPVLRVEDSELPDAQTYPLLGERYVIGRSSRSCDIVIRNPIVSQVHFRLERLSGRRRAFVLHDENSTNGIFRGRRRIRSLELHHRDTLTLGPPELATAVTLRYLDPPPWYIQVLRWAVYGSSLLLAILLLLIAIEWQKFTVLPLPAFNRGPIIIMSRDQQPLTPDQNRVHGELKSLREFSPYLPKAVIASEDTRYYWHLGVDPLGVLRAVITNVASGDLREGASTITQQVARSLFRSYVGTEDSAGRKFREAVVALKLESAYSKDFILLTYLNRVYLGEGNQGFEDAARFYFDKSAKDLTLSEAATLVGILPAPNTFNPVTNYKAAIEYRNRVLTRMVEQGMVTAAEADRARRSRIEVSPKAKEELQSIRAPYYYSYVFDELDTLLSPSVAQEGNFIVQTGLDLNLQATAEAALRQGIDQDGPTYGFSQGALITMDYEAGEILALVGGKDYATSQFNRATQALRQPGSTFKVFDYAAALNQGISPSRTYSCAPLTWQGQNFSGCRSGADSMDLYQGLAQSENPIALRLAQDVGLDNIIRLAKQMGVKSSLQANPGLVLGQSEATLLEMSQSFAVLAAGGMKNPPLAISKILDAGDCQNPRNIQTCRVIYDRRSELGKGERVLPADVAATMTNMLQGAVTSGTARAASLGLGEAGKTGTTNDGRDLWFIGYIPSRNLLTGIWLGNDNNTPTSGSSGQAASIWHDYMQRIVQ
jgi:penicillin-binding protein 1A